MEDLEFKEEWKTKFYQWPVTAIPDAATVAAIGVSALARGGRINAESHADRGVTMTFPNKAIPGTTIRKQIPRCECRRRAQITLPIRGATLLNGDPLKVCVVCDAAHLWPSLATPA